MLEVLREDCLRSTAEGFSVRLSLPWIRSLPLASLIDVELSIDGRRERDLRAEVGERSVTLPDLSSESGWWFLQDRVVFHGRSMLTPGAHDVAGSFRLTIPYLPAGQDGPLQLPFHIAQTMVLDAEARTPTVSRDVA